MSKKKIALALVVCIIVAIIIKVSLVRPVPQVIIVGVDKDMEQINHSELAHGVDVQGYSYGPKIAIQKYPLSRFGQYHPDLIIDLGIFTYGDDVMKTQSNDWPNVPVLGINNVNQITTYWPYLKQVLKTTNDHNKEVDMLKSFRIPLLKNTKDSLQIPLLNNDLQLWFNGQKVKFEKGVK